MCSHSFPTRRSSDLTQSVSHLRTRKVKIKTNIFVIRKIRRKSDQTFYSQDHARVWADVLAFQQLGFNVWLDERNLDKTKDSWTEDALSAISDLDCLLVLFYVSSSSLTSEACYRELSQTTEALTKCIHFGPVRFIAVDVENVGDIGAFTQEVYTNLMRRKDISKKEKTAKAIVLSQFCENFFGSNNERVRVHPKDEPNRKID